MRKRIRARDFLTKRNRAFATECLKNIKIMVNQKSTLTAVSYSCTLLFLMKNCHYIDGIIFCSAGYGNADSWKDCQITCNLKWMNIFEIALLL